MSPMLRQCPGSVQAASRQCQCSVRALADTDTEQGPTDTDQGQCLRRCSCVSGASQPDRPSVRTELDRRRLCIREQMSRSKARQIKRFPPACSFCICACPYHRALHCASSFKLNKDFHSDLEAAWKLLGSSFESVWKLLASSCV